MFYERIQQLCRIQNTTVTSMLNELGLSTGSTGNWKKGQLPKGDVLAKIADYLNTSVDYLIGRQTDPVKMLTAEESELLHCYQMLSPENRIRLKERAAVLLEMQDEKK